MHCIRLDSFYALLSMYYELTLKLVVDRQTDRPTDRPTDRQTDRRTLLRIELLSQLKITNKYLIGFMSVSSGNLFELSGLFVNHFRL